MQWSGFRSCRKDADCSSVSEVRTRQWEQSNRRLTVTSACPFYSGPSSPSTSKSRWAQRRKSSLSLASPDRERELHHRTARSATSASASAVHAAAVALADLSEDGFQSALALSRQWRSSRVDSVESQVQHPDPPMSPPRPHPPPRSVPVVCRESISWHDDEDDALSPSSVLSFDLDELDNDAFGRSSSSSSTGVQSARSVSSDWSTVLDYHTSQSRRASRKASAWGPDSLARRLSTSLRLGQELCAPSAPRSRASSSASSVFPDFFDAHTRRRSSSVGGQELRFRPSLAPRGSTSCGVYFHLDEEETTPQQQSSGGSAALISVADELALMSEQAMSDSGSPTVETSGMSLQSSIGPQQHIQHVDLPDSVP